MQPWTRRLRIKSAAFFAIVVGISLAACTWIEATNELADSERAGFESNDPQPSPD